MIESFTHTIQNYANFNGRARRREFWLFVLAQMIITAFLARFYGEHNLVAQAAELLLFIPFVALTWRRLQDQNISGWLSLIALTIIGLIPLFFLMMVEGTRGDNQYGPDPKAPAAAEVDKAPFQPRRDTANQWYHEDVSRPDPEPRTPDYRNDRSDLV